MKTMKPAWWVDPQPGDRVETRYLSWREVIGRPDGKVEYRGVYGNAVQVTLQSWQAWADRNEAKIVHYGT